MSHPLIYTPESVLNHQDGLERTAIEFAQRVVNDATHLIFDKDDEFQTTSKAHPKVKARAVELMREAGWEVGVLTKQSEGFFFQQKPDLVVRVPGGKGLSVQKGTPDYDFGFCSRSTERLVSGRVCQLVDISNQLASLRNWSELNEETIVDGLHGVHHRCSIRARWNQPC